MFETINRKSVKNPREHANTFSILFFFWILPFFKNCYRKIPELNEIPVPLNVDKSKSLGDRLDGYVNCFE